MELVEALVLGASTPPCRGSESPDRTNIEGSTGAHGDAGCLLAERRSDHLIAAPSTHVGDFAVLLGHTAIRSRPAALNSTPGLSVPA